MPDFVHRLENPRSLPGNHRFGDYEDSLLPLAWPGMKMIRNSEPVNPADTPRTWHVLHGVEIASELNVRPEQGLTAAEVIRRQQMYGANEIVRTGQRRVLRLLLQQFSDVMILLLAGAAVLSGLLGDLGDTLVILAILLLNAALGFSQEYRAERALEALGRLAEPVARVRRDGAVLPVATTGLVPGDVVLLEAGNLVPADLRLIEAIHLRLNESALTGESEEIGKTDGVLADPELPLGDRRNMAWRGTIVAAGRGAGLVVATGMHTELGRMADLLQQQPNLKTPLQQRLIHLTGRLALAFLGLCGIVVLTGLLRGESFVTMALTGLSLAVAAVPEALPAVVTITLSLGARSMARQHALIRVLPAVETLGSVTWIGTDKTGTLTENRMRLEQMILADPAAGAGSPLFRRFHEALVLNSDVRRGGDGNWLGDPTETALFSAAFKAGLDPEAIRQEYPRIAEIPFDSERRRMATLHAGPRGDRLVVKGSPESVLPLCRTIMAAWGGVGPLDPGAWLAEAEAMAARGLRVLAIASREWTQRPSLPQEQEADLTLLGLAGLIDPPRPEAAAAVATCRRAGITPVMITGDHPRTAMAIAHQVGIVQEIPPPQTASAAMLTGTELTHLSEEQLDQAAAHVRVYARVAAEQKIRIIAALQRRGEVVAMTGDGVNDAPALRRAAVGVAMGLNGTDVARDAADIVLLDDNFATIVAAIAEGRHIYDNIRRFIRYILTCNLAEVWTLLLAPALGLPLPLQPLQILWINLITDGLPGLALSAEPPETNVMLRPPRPPRESLFAGGLGTHVLFMGVLMAALTLGTQAWAIHSGDTHWQTMTFATLTFVQMSHVLTIRSEHLSLFQLGLGSNRPLVAAVALTILLQLAVIYLPAARGIFHTAPLDLAELAVCIASAILLGAVVEGEKRWRRRNAAVPV